jgi:hypothetical protein
MKSMQLKFNITNIYYYYIKNNSKMTIDLFVTLFYK